MTFVQSLTCVLLLGLCCRENVQEPMCACVFVPTLTQREPALCCVCEPVVLQQLRGGRAGCKGTQSAQASTRQTGTLLG
jgi:hypothetical protein